ncbi:hypothetical protein QA645_39570 [Bradyrhizobium sp. CIAT3101]|uniref:hypothetical protein n=1 Tax=Bradyrhizobium sp. CIAT3101 TaxID=439387 RepID=UPI0024B1FA8D|nr:hypothetical protein [Bradyrhizobium sp. CIAT3101]WFU80507.1 hypothetical protein QA645_39570 [Bradyrhizobium sp. CIAT3101]
MKSWLLDHAPDSMASWNHRALSTADGYDDLRRQMARQTRATAIVSLFLYTRHVQLIAGCRKSDTPQPHPLAGSRYKCFRCVGRENFMVGTPIAVVNSAVADAFTRRISGAAGDTQLIAVAKLAGRHMIVKLTKVVSLRKDQTLKRKKMTMLSELSITCAVTGIESGGA